MEARRSELLLLLGVLVVILRSKLNSKRAKKGTLKRSSPPVDGLLVLLLEVGVASAVREAVLVFVILLSIVMEQA